MTMCQVVQTTSWERWFRDAWRCMLQSEAVEDATHDAPWLSVPARVNAPGSEVAVRAMPYSTLNLELRPPTTTSSKRKVLISGSPAILCETDDPSDGARRRSCRRHGASTRETAVWRCAHQELCSAPTLAKCHQCCFVCTSLVSLIPLEDFRPPFPTSPHDAIALS